jgi:TPR repeat protein
MSWSGALRRARGKEQTMGADILFLVFALGAVLIVKIAWLDSSAEAAEIGGGGDKRTERREVVEAIKRDIFARMEMLIDARNNKLHANAKAASAAIKTGVSTIDRKIQDSIECVFEGTIERMLYSKYMRNNMFAYIIEYQMLVDWCVFEKELTQCIYEWVSQADAGDATTQYLLGAAFLYGFGVPANRKNALYYLNMAAQQNHNKALTLLNFEFVLGVEVNPKLISPEKAAMPQPSITSTTTKKVSLKK